MNAGFGPSDGTPMDMRTSLLAILAVAACATACHKGSSTTADGGGVASLLAPKDVTADFASALVEHHENGTVAMVVGPDGKASALIKNADGTVMKGKITGTMTFGTGADAKAVPVEVEEGTGVVRAAGPPLTADVTPMSYALVVDGQPWNGAVELPPAGTAELVATAKLQPDPATAKVGPHGGIIQVVGPDHIEIVADKDAGQARVFVLDSDLKPVDLGDRKVTLAFRDADVEVVHLVPEPKHRWLVAPVVLHDDPARITVVVHNGPVVHSCIVGYTPTAHLVVVSPKAPRTHVFVTGVWAWGPRVKVRGHGHGHGHWEYDDDEDVVFVGGAPGVVVARPGVVVQGPGVIVGGPAIHVGGPAVHVGGGGGAVHVGGHGKH